MVITFIFLTNVVLAMVLFFLSGALSNVSSTTEFVLNCLSYISILICIPIGIIYLYFSKSHDKAKTKLSNAVANFATERLGNELMLDDDEIPKMQVIYGEIVEFEICFITFNHDVSNGTYWIRGQKDDAPVSTSFIEVWEHIYDEVTTNGYM